MLYYNVLRVRGQKSRVYRFKLARYGFTTARGLGTKMTNARARARDF